MRPSCVLYRTPQNIVELTENPDIHYPGSLGLTKTYYCRSVLCQPVFLFIVLLYVSISPVSSCLGLPTY
jgi:hypothetical protein